MHIIGTSGCTSEGSLLCPALSPAWVADNLWPWLRVECKGAHFYLTALSPQRSQVYGVWTFKWGLVSKYSITKDKKKLPSGQALPYSACHEETGTEEALSTGWERIEHVAAQLGVTGVLAAEMCGIGRQISFGSGMAHEHDAPTHKTCYQRSEQSSLFFVISCQAPSTYSVPP